MLNNPQGWTPSKDRDDSVQMVLDVVDDICCGYRFDRPVPVSAADSLRFEDLLDARLVGASRGFVRFVDAPLHELLGQRLRDLPFIDRPTVVRVFSLALAARGETVHEGVEPLERTDVAAMPVASSARLHVEDGLIVGMWASFADHSAEARAVRQQALAEKALVQSQQLSSVGFLASGMAHDFENILTAIAGTAEFLLADARPSDHETRRYAMDILQASERASRLAKRILSFSSNARSAPGPHNITDVLRDVAPLLRRLLPLRVHLQVAPEPPDGMESPSVRVDLADLERSIVNLVANARDAIKDKGFVGLSVDVRTPCARLQQQFNLEDRDCVVVSVSDTGEGISPAVQARMFEPFFSTKSTDRGTGLGLSVVMRTVLQASGAVDVQSSLGNGTTASIWLPVSKPSLREPESPTLPLALAPRVGHFGDVLLVDDDRVARQVTELALVRAGYSVHSVSNGTDALAVLREQVPDLVVSDLVMPGLGGFELYDRLREWNPKLPVLFFTAMSVGTFDEPDADPLASVLYKPSRPSILVKRVDALLAAARDATEAES